MIKDILQTSEEFKRILRDINNGVQAHSYLFASVDEYSAKEMARLTAQALLCPSLCEKCENCIKFQHEHPDVKYFPKKNQLLVEDSNYIVEESFVKPIFADKKIFIIDDFDKSTTEAQNKLLKVLEEPNTNMYYLLSTSNLANILPTIKSRCFKVEVGSLNKDKIEKELKNIDRNITEIAIALGNGYLGRTIELSKKQNLKEIFDLAVEIICKFNSSKETIVYSKKLLEQKDDICFIFEIISQIMEDFIAIKTKKKDLMKLNFIERDLNMVVEDYSMRCITEVERLLLKSMKELSFFTNLTLVIDNFLMSLLEVKYICK